MKYVRRDVFVVARHKPSRLLVERDEARRVRRTDAFVRVVHAGGGVEVKVVPMDQNRAVRAVMRPNASARGQIENPDDVGVEWTCLEQIPFGGWTQWLKKKLPARHRVGGGNRNFLRAHVRAFLAKKPAIA